MLMYIAIVKRDVLIAYDELQKTHFIITVIIIIIMYLSIRYQHFQELKQQNPAMKTLLAVGGWNMASGPFTQMVATQQSRAQFIQSAVAFLRKNGFDGLDVDWEYPANRGSPAGDRDLFSALLRVTRMITMIIVIIIS